MQTVQDLFCFPPQCGGPELLSKFALKHWLLWWSSTPGALWESGQLSYFTYKGSSEALRATAAEQFTQSVTTATPTSTLLCDLV